MIEIELKAFIDVLKASNLTKAKIAHGKARVWLDLDKLTMVYNGQETPLKRQSLNYGGYRYCLYCPNCGEARTSLYWYCEALSCRKCLGLHNRTLNRSKTDCVYYWEQAVKEAQKIVAGYEAKDYITPDFPDKPKRMHWKTYYKHRAKYYQYWRKGEDLWLNGASRLLKS